MLQFLQHVEFVVDHLLVSLDVLLENDLDSDLAGRAVSLSDNSIGAGTQSSAKSVFGPIQVI